MEEEIVVPIDTSPRDILSSITVVEQVYYRAGDEDPTHIDTRYSRTLTSHEQVYERRMKVGVEWQAIDTGWIDRCAMFIIKNEEGIGLQRNPTVEQQAGIDTKIVEIGYGEISLFKIPPKESFRGIPSLDFKRFLVRCLGGETRIRIYLIPE